MLLKITESDLSKAPMDLLVLCKVIVSDETVLITDHGEFRGRDILAHAYSRLPILYHKVDPETNKIDQACYDWHMEIQEVDPNLIGYYTLLDTKTDQYGLQTTDGRWLTDATEVIIYLSELQASYQAQTSASTWQKIKNVKEAAGRVAKAWHEARHIKVNKDVQKARLDICKACPERAKSSKGDVCSRCGCYLKAKTAIAVEACPLRRWKAELEV